MFIDLQIMKLYVSMLSVHCIVFVYRSITQNNHHNTHTQLHYSSYLPHRLTYCNNNQQIPVTFIAPFMYTCMDTCVCVCVCVQYFTYFNENVYATYVKIFRHELNNFNLLLNDHMNLCLSTGMFSV